LQLFLLLSNGNFKITLQHRILVFLLRIIMTKKIKLEFQLKNEKRQYLLKITFRFLLKKFKHFF